MLADSDERDSGPACHCPAIPGSSRSFSDSWARRVLVCSVAKSSPTRWRLLSTSIKIVSFSCRKPPPPRSEARRTNVGLSPSSRVPASPHPPSFYIHLPFPKRLPYRLNLQQGTRDGSFTETLYAISYVISKAVTNPFTELKVVLLL